MATPHPPALRPRTVSSAAALLVGNELLTGKVVEGNLAPLAKMLRSLGIPLLRSVVLPDDTALIAREVRLLSEQHDVVFTSGGVGPTHDDVTLAAVAEAFEVPLKLHPDLEALMRGVYGERCDEPHLRMARVPEGAVLKHADEVRWPTVVMRNVWIFPGVPELFRMKLMTARRHLRGTQPRHGVALLLKLEETRLAESLDGVVAEFPDVEIGSYPKWFDPTYKTKITFDAARREDALAARQALIEALPEAASGQLVDE